MQTLGLDIGIGRRRTVRGLSSSARKGSGTVDFLGCVLPSMGSLSVSMSKGENELVKRSGSPDDQNKEDGLLCQSRRVRMLGTYEVFEDSEEDFFHGSGPVSTYKSAIFLSSR